MEIVINLERDSDNTRAGTAKLTTTHNLIHFELENPQRTISLNAEDLLKILGILF